MNTLHGDLENFPLRVFAMNEEDYAMMMMFNYGENGQVGDEKFRTIDGLRISFKCPETVHNH